jgi:hypothetical protein
MGDDFHVIANPMLTLDEYYAQLNEEEKINGDDMFYDEVIKVEMQLTSPRSGI